MHRSNQGRCVRAPPSWLRKGIGFFSIGLQQVLNRTGDLSQIPRRIEQVHLVILVAHLVRQAARPSLDLVELELLLIVPGLAHVHRLTHRQPARPASWVAGDEHDETAVLDIVDAVITILARLDHLVFEKVLVKPVDCLLRAIVPARIYPFLACCVRPCLVDLSDNGL